ncbi:MAG: hypothetical protein HY692_06540 [Cyanobacteria bacterium NC_groundwater_1444_Ag_S-0.65um_54_12]|nr:hypothetical protein [Cyanobacteria bacterium NC_groundwater_1444_Ag_S-0.65um_54_12]
MIWRCLLPASMALVLLFGCQSLEGAREHSYKWNQSGPRFLQDYLRPSPLAKLGNLASYTNSDREVLKSLQQARERAQYLAGITQVDEDVFLVLEDVTGIGYTLSIHNGNLELREGLREGVKPSLVVALRRQDVLGLPALLAARGTDARGRAISGLSEEGLFRLVRLLLIPALQVLYAQDAFNPPGNRAVLGLDDFVQLQITPPLGSELPPILATILNIDGQWLFLEGWHGDPDIRIRLSALEALSLYQTGSYELKKSLTPVEKALVIQRFNELRQKAIVYTRTDHR